MKTLNFVGDGVAMWPGPTGAPQVLVGRESQKKRLDDLLTEARRGRSGTLVIHGDAGVGKTALLDYARQSADDFLRLHAMGFASDADLPFSGLSQVLRPIQQLVPSLPEAQRRALEGALALGPPAPAGRFAVSTGTLSLLAAAAEERPVLVTVDDLQWVDHSSVEALVFAARRLQAEGVVVLLGSRDAVGQIPTGLPALHLEGLDPSDAVALLRRRSAGAIHPDVARAIVDVTRGYPLPIVELATQLRAEQLRGIEPLPEPLPAGRSMEDWYRRQVEALPLATRRALLVLGALDPSTPWLLDPVLQRMALDRSALDEAVRAGLVQTSGDVPTFRHPLISSAIYHLADAERRSIHATIAALLPEREVERRVWHRAQATVGPSEPIAAELEEVARHATLRHGAPAAARALERAAELSEDATSRDRRLYEAADAWHQAGRWQRALALLDEMEGSADPSLVARVEYLRGRIELWTGKSSDAIHRLTRAAHDIEQAEPATAAAMLSEAAGACTMAAALDQALELATHAYAIARGTDLAAETLSAATLAHASSFKGDFARARALVAVAESGIARLPQPSVIAAFLVNTLLTLEEFDRARDIAERCVETFRSLGAPTLLPFILAAQCELDFRTGRWNSSLAVGSEAVRLAEELGQEGQLTYCLVAAARIEAAIGAEAECRGSVARALAHAERLGTRSIEHYAAAVIGFLELGLGRISAAIGPLQHRAALQSEAGLEAPSVVWSQPDLIEALARDGQVDAAQNALVALETQATKTGSRWATACVARCRGMLARDASYEEHFEASLRLLAPMPFEEARTLLCYGEKLRSGRRRRQAAERLHAALSTFERLGAQPWATRARNDLSQLGEERPAAPGPLARVLTRQELQISLMVSEGLTNQEVADRLFLSRKTVETHLSSAYRKLAVRSRTDLVRLVIRDAPASAVTG